MELGVLLAWWNLVYLAPLGLSIVFLGAQISGIEGDFDGADLPAIEGDADADVDVDADADVDVDADADVDIDADADLDVDADVDVDADADIDVDADVDVDVDADADVDVDADADADLDADGHVEVDIDADADLDADVDGAAETHVTVTSHDGHVAAEGPSLALQIAHFVGVGRVPISLLGMCLSLTWGMIGLTLNSALRMVFTSPSIFFPISFFGTAILSLGVTSTFARVVGNLMPKTSTFGTKRAALAGSIGKTLYRLRPGKDGTIRVRDEQGNLIQCAAFTKAKKEIPGSTEVLLIRYSRKRKAFEVELAPEELKTKLLEEDDD